MSGHLMRWSQVQIPEGASDFIIFEHIFHSRELNILCEIEN